MTLPKKTLGAVLYETGWPLEIEELTLPDLLPGQVLVEMAFSGVCHSQLLEADGRRGPDRYLPHVMGHEASGHVLAVGGEVRKVAPGDAVVLSWIPSAGCAAPGPVYHSHRGEKINAGPVATFLQHAVVAENRCVRLPPGTPLDIAALWGCALPTGCGTIFRKLNACPGQSFVLLGAGGVGLSALLAAGHRECSPRIVVDISEEKLAFARGLGATHTFLFNDRVKAEVLAVTAGRGADLVVEASGNRLAMEMALSLTRDRGGRAVLAGNTPAGEKISVDPFALIYGRVLMGTAGGESALDEDIPLFESLVGNPSFPMEKLLGERYALKDINTAMARLRAGALGRTLIAWR